MSDIDYDDLADMWVSAFQTADVDTIQRIVGDWDGDTGAPAWWIQHVVRLLEAVTTLVPNSEAEDWVAVERACAGDYRYDKLSRAERFAAVQALTERGLSSAEIGRRLGVTPRTVNRTRSQLARTEVA